MKIKNKLLAILAPCATVAVVAPTFALNSCGGGGNTPTGDRTNNIIWEFKEALITYSDTFTADMTLEKELASGQTITGHIKDFSGLSGGSALVVKSVVTSGKIARVTFKYGTAPTVQGVDKFTVIFTGSTNGKEEWTTTIPDMIVTYSKS